MKRERGGNKKKGGGRRRSACVWGSRGRPASAAAGRFPRLVSIHPPAPPRHSPLHRLSSVYAVPSSSTPFHPPGPHASCVRPSPCGAGAHACAHCVGPYVNNRPPHRNPLFFLTSFLGVVLHARSLSAPPRPKGEPPPVAATPIPAAPATTTATSPTPTPAQEATPATPATARGGRRPVVDDRDAHGVRVFGRDGGAATTAAAAAVLAAAAAAATAVAALLGPDGHGHLDAAAGMGLVGRERVKCVSVGLPPRPQTCARAPPNLSRPSLIPAPVQLHARPLLLLVAPPLLGATRVTAHVHGGRPAPRRLGRGLAPLGGQLGGAGSGLAARGGLGLGGEAACGGRLLGGLVVGLARERAGRRGRACERARAKKTRGKGRAGGGGGAGEGPPKPMRGGGGRARPAPGTRRPRPLFPPEPLPHPGLAIGDQHRARAHRPCPCTASVFTPARRDSASTSPARPAFPPPPTRALALPHTHTLLFAIRSSRDMPSAAAGSAIVCVCVCVCVCGVCVQSGWGGEKNRVWGRPKKLFHSPHSG